MKHCLQNCLAHNETEQFITILAHFCFICTTQRHIYCKENSRGKENIFNCTEAVNEAPQRSIKKLKR